MNQKNLEKLKALADKERAKKKNLFENRLAEIQKVIDGDYSNFNGRLQDCCKKALKFSYKREAAFIKAVLGEPPENPGPEIP